jgi:hypothetical protein
MPFGRDHKQTAGNGAPRLAVVVPATDAPSTLGACLAALDSSRVRPDEVVVVDSPPGAGPAEARNAGAARTSAEILMFVDSDVVVSPEAVGRVREAFAADPGLAAVFGSYDADPAAPGVVSRYRNLLHHHVHTTSPGPASTFWAGLGAVRRGVFEAAGGFDAGRFPDPAVEDIDLGMRLAERGARITLDPAIRGKHLKRWGLREMVRTDFARRALPWARLTLERRAAGTELNLGWRHRLGAFFSLALAAAAVGRRPRAAVLSACAIVAAHLPFFALLARRGGPPLAGAGVVLQVVHHLSAVAALPVALAGHLRSRTGSGR